MYLKLNNYFLTFLIIIEGGFVPTNAAVHTSNTGTL